MGERGSFLTSPVTGRRSPAGRWSASKKSSGVTSPLKTTHWMMPVPSRTWRKWSLPEERAVVEPAAKGDLLPLVRGDVGDVDVLGHLDHLRGRGRRAIYPGSRPIAQVQNRRPAVISRASMTSMNERYEPKSIEPKWQKRWEKPASSGPAAAPRPRSYVLEMLPYPSGADAHGARAQLPPRRRATRATAACRASTCCTRWAGTRLGLPAENAAHQGRRATPPSAPREHRSFKSEMKRLGLRLRLGRARSTPPSPSTTAGTSGSSCKMLEKGLVYRRLSQGELVHRLPHRHRQRAGEGRHVRALRLAGGRQGDARVGLPHHATTPTSCSTGSTA